MSELNTNEKDPKWKIHRLNPKAVENEYLFIQKIEDTYILGDDNKVITKDDISNAVNLSKLTLTLFTITIIILFILIYVIL